MTTNQTAATNQGYNGWTNYETWAVSLWLDTDDPSDIIERVKEDYEDDKEQWADEIAKKLESWVDERNPISDNSLYSDLLNASLSEVNWLEIAEHYLEE